MEEPERSGANITGRVVQFSNLAWLSPFTMYTLLNKILNIIAKPELQKRKGSLGQGCCKTSKVAAT